MADEPFYAVQPGDDINRVTTCCRDLEAVRTVSGVEQFHVRLPGFPEPAWYIRKVLAICIGTLK